MRMTSSLITSIPRWDDALRLTVLVYSAYVRCKFKLYNRMCVMPCDKMKPMDFALEGWIEVAQEGWIDIAYKKKVYNVVRQKVATDLHTDRFDCS